MNTKEILRTSKDIITSFIDNLIKYDYILFGSVFLIFIILIIIGILLRRKIGLSIFIVFLAFLMLFITPIVGYIKMHEYLFKNSVELKSQKKLTFTNAIVVKGSLTNESKFNFKSCNISASAYKVTGNVVKDLIYPFKPLQKTSIIEYDILRGDTIDFKIIVEPFTYTKDYNISIGAKCK